MERPIEIDPAALAVTLFDQGYTCGQAVLAAFAAKHGLDRDLALRVACAYGGGVARTGATCGAVNGALMVIGLAHGRHASADERRETHGGTVEMSRQRSAVGFTGNHHRARPLTFRHDSRRVPVLGGDRRAPC